MGQRRQQGKNVLFALKRRVLGASRLLGAFAGPMATAQELSVSETLQAAAWRGRAVSRQVRRPRSAGSTSSDCIFRTTQRNLFFGL